MPRTRSRYRRLHATMARMVIALPALPGSHKQGQRANPLTANPLAAMPVSRTPRWPLIGRMRLTSVHASSAPAAGPQYSNRTTRGPVDDHGRLPRRWCPPWASPGASVVGDDPAADGVPGQRVVPADPQLLGDVRHVAAHGMDADAQHPSDLGRWVAGRDETE